MDDLILAHAGSGGWGLDWMYLATPLWVYGVCVLALFGAGQSPWEGNPIKFFFRQISDSLRRLTGFPGWSMAGALSGLMALLIAVIGFYWDVAWHIDYGRDDQLFTPSHVMILVGLGGLLYAAVVAVIFASIDRAEVGLSLGPVRIPWSALVLATMGAGGVAAFPVDDLWHQAYGLDVTLWSPPHLQLVAGGSLATIALWLMVAEALRAARPTPMGNFIHVVVAGAVLVGVTTFEGEFDFGSPQFRVLYHPLLMMAAAGFALVLARLALGPGGAIKTVVAYLVIRGVVTLLVTGALNHTLLRFPLYLPSAVAIEAAAFVVQTDRRLRFALVAGGLMGTLGLVGELAWVELTGWGDGATISLLELALVPPLAAVAAAVLGAGLARAFSRPQKPIPIAALALAGLGLVAALAYPLPRRVGDVDAVIRLDRSGERARVEVELQPPDAAENANAFGIGSWQGGGTESARLEELAPGRYVSDRTVPVTGRWKTMVALQRGDEMMAAPIYMAADPFIKAPAIPAIPERRVAFVRNTELLLRETHPGPAWPAVVAYGTWGGFVAFWVALMALTAVRVSRDHPASPPVDQAAAPSSPRHPTQRASELEDVELDPRPTAKPATRAQERRRGRSKVQSA